MTDTISIKIWHTKPNKPAAYVDKQVFLNRNISPEGLKVYGVLFCHSKSNDLTEDILRTISRLMIKDWQAGIANLVTNDVLIIHKGTYYLGNGNKKAALAVMTECGVSPSEIEDAIINKYNS